MSYIGKDIKSVSTANITVDSMTGDGTANTLALSLTMVDSIYDVAVYIQGLAKVPGVDYTLSNKTITFTTPPANGHTVIAVSTGDASKNSIIANSVSADSLKDNSITDAKMTGSVDASKLTGTLPAIDGSALTNINTSTAMDINTIDPVPETNPADGVGRLWLNKTTGKLWVCTNAETNYNHWTNIGLGSGTILPPWKYGGTQFAFTGSGNDMSGVYTNPIQKIDFSSDALSATTMSLNSGRYSPASMSGATDGYISGGAVQGADQYSQETEKFSFTSTSQSSGVASLNQGRRECAGHNTETHGFVTGGAIGSGALRTGSIEKINFASDSSYSNHATLASARKAGAGMSSITHGYYGGGFEANNLSNNTVVRQEKFSFSAGNTVANVADLLEARESQAGCSSSTHGYTCAGWVNRIERINFSNDVEQTDVGDVNEGHRAGCAGSSSLTHGYVSGGWYRSSVDKFSFASGTPSIDDIGDFSAVYHNTAGWQY